MAETFGHLVEKLELNVDTGIRIAANRSWRRNTAQAILAIIGEGDDRNIAMRAAQEPFRPSTQGRVALGNVGQRRARSMDQLPAQVCGRTPT
jgi:hypothetical protein